MLSLPLHALVMIHAKHPASHPAFAIPLLSFYRGESHGSERSGDSLNVIQLPGGRERSLLKSEVDDNSLLSTLRRHSQIFYLPSLVAALLEDTLGLQRWGCSQSMQGALMEGLPHKALGTSAPSPTRGTATVMPRCRCQSPSHTHA